MEELFTELLEKLFDTGATMTYEQIVECVTIAYAECDTGVSMLDAFIERFCDALRSKDF